MLRVSKSPFDMYGPFGYSFCAGSSQVLQVKK